MYVCLCNNVTDKQIRQAVAGGVDSFLELQFETGVASCCGKCESCAREVMSEALCAKSSSVAWFPSPARALQAA
ncbi:bacterioferritin-associated ferredoxin [Chitinilyticum piscinae]|uniref:Bacterioferritin-associated ferredoxin n=1 Tax=Chitinilyticum piscinae TaxID=2866724 RepID=A0A8J7K124_9NEIS|nr:bacterioferritin-associated ferredoxin [Chitinilyticum piscinae]MBE9608591.1 bacterioferritin-associated ferredoxin [Chitinilyticum piscinae]